MTLIDDDTAEYIEWDLTGMVQEWVDGTYTNKGVFLHAISGCGVFVFYSRDHLVLNQSPVLVITTQNEIESFCSRIRCFFRSFYLPRAGIY